MCIRISHPGWDGRDVHRRAYPSKSLRAAANLFYTAGSTTRVYGLDHRKLIM